MTKIAGLPSSLDRRAILVLGMHRSGTSALGGLINTLGAAGPKTSLPSNASNPRGFFESLPLVTAHDELLASAGSSWHEWRQLNPQWINSEAAEVHRQKIKALLIDEFGDEPLIIIKDPRICRFVPFMSSILAEMNVSPVAFLPVRNPLEVAHSLQRRDKIALPKSLLLWLRHVLDAEYHSRHLPRYFLPYEGLLIDWRNHMDRAAEETGLIWPVRSDGPDVEIEQFLTMDLYHERSTLEDMQNHPDITAVVRETYEILTAIVADGEKTDLLDRLDLVRMKFDEGCETFGAAVAAEELAVEQLRGHYGMLNAEAERIRQENSKLTTFLEQQSTIVRVLAGERDALTQANNSLLAERNALATAQNGLIAERDDLLRDRDGVVGERNALLAERNNLATAQDRLIAERDALLRDRDGVVGERNALLASRSWRLTAPLRGIRRLFAR
ncbi:sulfotransferase family protein [Mesorhizobium sp. WSM4312]|uniref:sulfotransferase family protein n=1 Tax=Mesorhizobium sp. WSM4312 TaxID=2029411 RepID=UPI000BAEA0E6|nr:sulfotransferase family protein [Mesorhizobium sp. WSM4312]PBB64782.1 sulfotransferase family protein [Mesorhizobium sp. WSM4312]